MAKQHHDSDTIRKLVEGDVTWEQLENEILPDPKDPTRFEQVREVLQAKVDWDEEILVPVNDHLYVVASDGDRVVKCDCGHEFCQVDDNWRTEAGIYVREDQSELDELYSDQQSPSADWEMQYREFYCPSCVSLLDVDSAPAGYPVFQKFEADIDGFYEEWLGKPAPDNRE